MSGIYIKGMEMPKNCDDCHFDFDCPYDESQDGYKMMGGRPRKCPLIPVPPHGDLVDRAEMREIAISLLDKAVTDQEANAIREMWSHLGQLPVYIPAEEDEA
jgi:hypothetical protein